MYIYSLANATASVITVTSTATTLYSLLDTAGSAANNLPGSLNAVDLVVESGSDVRILFDGNTPTASLGILLSQGAMYSFRGVPLTQLKLIRTGSSNASVSVQVGYSKEGESSNAAATSVTIETGDIEIGAVELKNGDDDGRAIINDANTARSATDNVLLVQAINAAGGVLGTAAMPVTFSTSVLKTSATGGAAINTTTAVAAEFRLVSITCHFSAAPTTSESFVVKLDSSLGAAYDTTLFSTNPSLSAATDIVFIPDESLDFFLGDEIVVTFTNTDTRTYGLTIYYELV